MQILTANIIDIKEEMDCAYHLQMLEWVGKSWVLGNWKHPGLVGFFFSIWLIMKLILKQIRATNLGNEFNGMKDKCRNKEKRKNVEDLASI